MKSRDFAAEQATYWQQRDQLLTTHPGKWVAVVGGQVVAVGNQSTAVMLDAFQKTGSQVMFVTKVGEEGTALRRRIRQTVGRYEPTYDPPAPMITATVHNLPQTVSDAVEFLADTGADGTVLTETTAQSLGVDQSPVALADIAGIGSSWEQRTLYGAIVELSGVSVPIMADVRDDLPENLLGRDVMNQFEMTFNAKQGRVIASVATP